MVALLESTESIAAIPERPAQLEAKCSTNVTFCRKLLEINNKAGLFCNLGESKPGARRASFKALGGVREVTSYRLYRIDGDGRISAAEWLEASDDRAAREQAASLCANGGAVEIWARDRLVARIETPRKQG